MKRLLATGLILCLMSIIPAADAFGYGVSSARRDARFLTDRMAYEMDLTESQYNDIYEVNYDFIYRASDILSYVARGEGWAINQYYDLLNVRNDDLRWILSDYQYNSFMGIDYFFRPIYTAGRNWAFRIYSYYNDRSVFYYRGGYYPRNYYYNGGHYRSHFNNCSWYMRQNRGFDDRRRNAYFGPSMSNRRGVDNRFDNRGDNRNRGGMQNNDHNSFNRNVGRGNSQDNGMRNNDNSNRNNSYNRGNGNRNEGGFNNGNRGNNNGNNFNRTNDNNKTVNSGSIFHRNNGNSLRNTDGNDNTSKRTFNLNRSNNERGNNEGGRTNVRGNQDRSSFNNSSRSMGGSEKNSRMSRSNSDTRSSSPSNDGRGRR